MREVKFRGKRLDTDEWVYGFVVLVGKRAFILKDIGGLSIEVDPATVGQYTGLKDKSGTPIFEGDIVAENGFKPAVIKFGTYQNNQERWGFDDSGYGYYCENEEDGQCGLDASIDTFEVVGNIYQNPELLVQRKPIYRTT